MASAAVQEPDGIAIVLKQCQEVKERIGTNFSKTKHILAHMAAEFKRSQTRHSSELAELVACCEKKKKDNRQAQHCQAGTTD